MTDHSATYDENGIRQFDPKMEAAPTFCYVCGVSWCPGCGACVGDYVMGSNKFETDEEAPPSLEFSDKEAGLKNLHKYINGPQEKPNNKLACGGPIQMMMEAGKPIEAFKNPDIVCNLCSILCCWRGMAVMFFVSISVPSMLAAKYGLGMFAVATISFCLCISLLARILAICCPKCFNMNTPSLRNTFLNVVDMKRVDITALGEAQKKGKTEKIKLQIWMAWTYFVAILKGFCCCQFFRPSVIFTFGKTLIVMLFTEMGMVVSAYLYFVARFAFGSGCWTLCSMSAWVREFMNSSALKKRIVTLQYPEWGYVAGEDKKAGGEVELEPPSCCGVKCTGCCPSCGCRCDLCCDVLCNIGCPLCCEMCNVGIDLGGEFFSAILLVGKALYFTQRMVVAGKKNNNAPDNVGPGPDVAGKKNET